MKLSDRLFTLKSFALLVLLGFSAPGEANIFETIFMPGKVINGHEQFELECDNCHESFDQSKQRNRCLACHDHQNIAKDIEEGTGFHGLMENSKNIECKTCHSDHMGRDADIVQLTHSTFNHDLTDYPLEGKHRTAACANCHEASQNFREAPNQCIDCHKDDDKHEGELGEQCDDCHKETGWQETEFDHDDTDFPLLDKHVEVNCSSCHADEQYEDIPTECVSCHRLNDAHGGDFGNECEKCHSEKDWDESKFDHNKDTEFDLKGSHKETSCNSCHIDPPFDKSPGDSCIDCHRSDDTHQGKNGEECKECHTENRWQKSSFNHDRDTDFKLKGSHEPLECHSCHKGSLEDELPADCISCHKGDDVHKGQQGDSCNRCHDEESFAGVIRFDHDLTDFPLIGQHAVTSCEECHLEQTFKDTALACTSCHRDDDVHKETLGGRCEQCHTPNDWGIWQFDHDTQTDFELTGKHQDQPCEACHLKSVKDQDDIDQASDCFSCHRSDDIHFGGFGRFCERCHTTESFDDTSNLSQ